MDVRSNRSQSGREQLNKSKHRRACGLVEWQAGVTIWMQMFAKQWFRACYLLSTIIEHFKLY